MYGRLTTIEFDSPGQRQDALTLLTDTIQEVRAMEGFQAAYYLDVDELHIIVVTIFDSQEELEAIEREDETLRLRARKIGVKFPRTEQYPVVAFATTGSP
jgi:heme-degrading monooxygenase HmoA